MWFLETLGDACLVQTGKTTPCTSETSPGVSDTSLAFKDQETGIWIGKEGLKVIKGTKILFYKSNLKIQQGNMQKDMKRFPH